MKIHPWIQFIYRVGSGYGENRVPGLGESEKGAVRVSSRIPRYGASKIHVSESLNMRLADVYVGENMRNPRISSLEQDWNKSGTGLEDVGCENSGLKALDHVLYITDDEWRGDAQ